MRHRTEDELIAYQMQESADASAVQAHLETCAECAALSDSIAETLRVFSGDRVPHANVEHAWQRLRGSLPAAPRTRQRSWREGALWMWLVPVAALLVLFAVAVRMHAPARRGVPVYANNRPGPLTAEPAGAMAAHLDSAERLLTEVNHASGPVDDTLRTQAHELALHNAVYIQQAHASGDLAQASLLEDLGRVLTTLEHEPATRKEDRAAGSEAGSGHGLRLRLEMNTDGLLLDLRILQQNDNLQQANDMTKHKDAQ